MMDMLKSIFKTVPAEANLNAIAGALKNAYGIDMDHCHNLSRDEYTITLSKDNQHLRFTISRFQYEDGKYEFIIRENVARFRKQLLEAAAVEQYIKDGMNPLAGKYSNIFIQDDLATMDSIVLDDLKKFKDTVVSNTTKFSKEDLDAIQRMKEAAHKIGAPGMNPIIAGGFFASIYWNEEPRDIDLFYLEGEGEHTVGFTIPEEYVSLKDGEYLKNPMITKVASFSVTKRQLIFTKYKTRRELVDHFDMLHCCVSYDVKEDKLYISPAVLDVIKRKIARPNGTNTIDQWRLEKFKKRGWTIEAVGV